MTAKYPRAMVATKGLTLTPKRSFTRKTTTEKTAGRTSRLAMNQDQTGSQGNRLRLALPRKKISIHANCAQLHSETLLHSIIIDKTTI